MLLLLRKLCSIKIQVDSFFYILIQKSFNFYLNFAGLILDYLNSSLLEGGNFNADVLIHCSNGVIPTHRLVLASISKMFLSIFKQNTWDELITVLIPNVTKEELTEALYNLYSGAKKEVDPRLTFLFKYDKNQSGHGDAKRFIFKEEQSDYPSETVQKHGQDILDNFSQKPVMEYVDVKLEEQYLDENDCLNEDSYNDNDDKTYVEIPQEEKTKRYRIDPETKKKIALTSKARDYFEVNVNPDGLVCKLCGAILTATKAKNMSGHLRSRHPDIFLACTKKKGTGTKMSPELQMYCEEVPDNPSKRLCKLCSKEIVWNNIQRHIGRKHGIYLKEPKQFVCSYCGRVFKEKWNRDNHEAEIHQMLGKEKTFKFFCAECGKGFTNKTYYETHLNKHSGEKPFQCPDCGTQFTSEQGLNQHLLRQACKMDNGISLTSLKCDTCQKEFSSIPKLKLHYLRSSLCSHGDDLKPFPCTECDKRFNTAKYLENHMRSHTGERPFQCEKCSKRFKFSNRLKYHNCIP